MKKFLSVFLAVFILFSFAACGENEGALSENNSSSSLQSKNENEDNDEITVERVKNTPETSAEKFITVLVEDGISIDGYIGEDEIVVIPETIDGKPVIEIGDSCFVNNQKLKGIKISDNVISIGRSAFMNCQCLEIFIPGDSVENIGDYAFGSCKSIKSVKFNNGLKSLGVSSFAYTDALEKIYIPSSTTDINIPFIRTQTHVTIITESGSAAEAYAKENGIKYEIR